MRSLLMPTRDAKSVLALCAQHVRDKTYAKRLNSVANEIADAEREYKKKGKASKFYKIKPAGSVANRVTVEEMARLYATTLSGRRSRIRYIYDDLKSTPRNGICPLCGQRAVSTLDHYLAKSLHPALAITPVNLVPSCSDCNKAKHDMQPSSASEQTLHPYFDKTDDDVWLIAKILETQPPALRFLAAPPNDWADLKRERIIGHFRILKLGELYSSHAAEELMNISFRLFKTSEREGPDGIQRFLTDSAESFRMVSNNSWQVAMYDALRESVWFRTEGYRLTT